MFLGFGTNLGDRAANLSAALRRVSRDVDVIAVSRVCESEPYGFDDQPYFWNMAAEVRTPLTPEKLLHSLKHAETEIGRTPTFRMGPRIIDIDILLWGDRLVESAALTVPHPGILQRMFVLVPLLDLDPSMTHPLTGRALAEHAAELHQPQPRDVGPAEFVLGGWND